VAFAQTFTGSGYSAMTAKKQKPEAFIGFGMLKQRMKQ
jgi:hypothetical protein